MHVAICIVAFRNPQDLTECLGALGALEYDDFEVVVCENGGAAAFAALRPVISERLPGGQRVTAFVAPNNLGYAGGVNLCIEKTPNADAWWVLNPDARPDAKSLGRMVERLQRGDCGAVGCTTHYSSGVVEARGGRWRPWMARAVSLDVGRQVDEPFDAPALERRLDYVSGASMLVGAGLVARVGRMREDYFLYGEEIEWCLRANAAGLSLGLAPDARVLHHQGTTTGSVSDVTKRSRTAVFLDERNKLLITRDTAPARLPVVALAALVMMLLRFARRGAWQQVAYGLAGWWSGLIGQRGKPAWIE